MASNFDKNRIAAQAIAAQADQPYVSHPSCTTCKVDYLGEGTCGACLFVVELLADVVIVLERAVKAEAALTGGVQREF